MPAPKTAESQTESVDFDVLVAIIGAVDEGEGGGGYITACLSSCLVFGFLSKGSPILGDFKLFFSSILWISNTPCLGRKGERGGQARTWDELSRAPITCAGCKRVSFQGN